MVSVQADCSLEEAMSLMRERAVVVGRTLDEIAQAVIERAIVFK